MSFSYDIETIDILPDIVRSALLAKLGDARCYLLSDSVALSSHTFPGVYLIFDTNKPMNAVPVSLKKIEEEGEFPTTQLVYIGMSSTDIRGIASRLRRFATNAARKVGRLEFMFYTFLKTTEMSAPAIELLLIRHLKPTGNVAGMKVDNIIADDPNEELRDAERRKKLRLDLQEPGEIDLREGRVDDEEVGEEGEAENQHLPDQSKIIIEGLKKDIQEIFIRIQNQHYEGNPDNAAQLPRNEMNIFLNTKVPAEYRDTIGNLIAKITWEDRCRKRIRTQIQQLAEQGKIPHNCEIDLLVLRELGEIRKERGFAKFPENKAKQHAFQKRDEIIEQAKRTCSDAMMQFVRPRNAFVPNTAGGLEEELIRLVGDFLKEKPLYTLLSPEYLKDIARKVHDLHIDEIKKNLPKAFRNFVEGLYISGGLPKDHQRWVVDELGAAIIDRFREEHPNNKLLNHVEYRPISTQKLEDIRARLRDLED